MITKWRVTRGILIQGFFREVTMMEVYKGGFMPVVSAWPKGLVITEAADDAE